MSDIEILAMIRGVIVSVGLVYAVRGRYWLLAAGLSIAAVISAFSALGTPRVVGSLLAVPFYGLLVLHTLDITRRRRHRRPAA